MKTINYTQIIKDFDIKPEDIERRMIVVCPVEMDYDELTERFREEVILSTWKNWLDFLAA